MLDVALNNKRLLILGSNSFAGSCLVASAVKHNLNVIGINRSVEKHPAFHAYKKLSDTTNYQFRQLDLNTNIDEIFSVIEEFKPNYIVDLAGQGMVAESWQNPDQWYMTNLVAKSKLFKFINELGCLDKYIRVSTPEVYGSTDELLNESMIYSPSTPYAISHAAVDMHLMAYHKQYNFPVILTRFSNFYGPGQQLYRIIPRTIIYSRMGKKLSLHGGGKAIRAFIYGDDVADGLLRTLAYGEIGSVYHFSTDSFVSIHDLVEKILLAQQIEFSSAVEVVADRPGKDLRYLMSDQRAREELSWSESTSLDRGIQKTIEWVDDYWDELQQQPLDYIHKR